MMSNREKELERRLVFAQRLWIDSMNEHIKTQAQLMLAQYEILRLEFGDDIEKDQPELYKSLKSKADGSWLREGAK